VANLAALGLAVLPLRASVARLEADADAALRDLVDANRARLDVASATANRAQADGELRRFYTDVLPRDFPTAERTANLWLTRAVADAGLDFRGSRFEWSAVRDSRLSRASSRVTLQGRYPNLRRFLYSVETAPEFVILESVELVQQQAAGGAPSGVLEVGLTVSTYFQSQP
jgi:Tfp pilus assembly protein PilO